MPELVVKFNEKVIEKVVTEKKRISIGRTKDNDIVLENRGVSRKHAQIEFNGDNAIIIDNESLNGVFVNNRRISEEMLRDHDIITIGKYSLEFNQETDKPDHAGQMDGTMILNTKQQRKLVDNDRKEREIVTRVGGTVILGLENTRTSEFKIDRDVTTIGKAKFVHIQARGFMISGIQAKIIKEGNDHYIVNLGRRGKTKVNGDVVTRTSLKNSDIIQVGKSTFRFVEGN
ncbi:MAG: FHA domain-containing protein [Candidatus Zixiibacteriota bacterium]